MLQPHPTADILITFHGFLPSTVNQNKSFYKTLLCYVIFCISIQVFMPYLILYYEVSLGIVNYVPILAPAVILAAAATFFWGKVYDKKGFDFSSAISILALVLGYVLLFCFKNIAMVFIGSLLMMCGYLCSTAVFGAQIRDLTPAGMAGRFQGVRIFSQVLIPGIVGPFIGKTILQNARQIVNNDGTTSFVPNENIFLGALAVLIVLIVLMLITRDKKQYRIQKLSTDIKPDDDSSWLTEHPRPQMMRNDVLNLCGSWQLSSLYNGKLTPLGDITVPFAPESALSGINRQKKNKEKYVYEKTFTVPDSFLGKELILHFDAVDSTAELYLNGEYLATHHGGYTPFDFHITNNVKDGENTIKVIVTDELDTNYPYGKQSKKRGGMWYTPISGIWQAVWLEAVPYKFVDSIKTDVTLDSVTFYVCGGESHKSISIDGVGEYEFDGDTFTLSIQNAKLWSPETPHLYYYTLTCGDDIIRSYFALRTIDIRDVNGKSYICLNGKPYFFHGLLDQGYWPDGIFTPATPKGYEYDILQMKKLGFNMLRKHIKSEPEAFYYYCDKHGMIVFQDFINSGKYSFLLDTALPTIGIKKGLCRPASKKRKEVFYENAIKLISKLKSHPSVCYYTIFNEGWGQHDHDAIYLKLKELQPNVVFDTASGWFIPNESDVKSEHVYFKKINLKSQSGKPLILSEFGGYSYKIPEHSFNLDKTYGYKICPNREDLNSSLEALYIGEVLPAITNHGLNATVLTQVSDVEDETNGLMTY
ncbi:MAG: MFS transporter, partial [Clostridiales bacterium]|nr:MFS transporter [Clostridiales bacterium]